MPQWAGSCWYYLRFLDPQNDDASRSASEAYDAWMPVDLYVGGAEHAVLHLLYARFWHKVLFDLGVVKHPEPFMKLVHQGMILGENNEKMTQVARQRRQPRRRREAHGADALRLYEMFMGPLEQVKPWQTSGIEGVRRFLDRVWNVVHGHARPTTPRRTTTTKRLVHKTIKKVTQDIEALRFNTAISAMMILVNHLGALAGASRARRRERSRSSSRPSRRTSARSSGSASAARRSRSPTSRGRRSTRRSCKDDVVEIGVQVNGKVRGAVTLARRRRRGDGARAPRSRSRRSRAHVEGKTVKKVIYVPGKILNFIVG